MASERLQFVELIPADPRMILYSWRRKDPRTGRWRLLAWKMTEEDARRWSAREGAELEIVAGSEEVRTKVGGYGDVFLPARISEVVNDHSEDKRIPSS